MHGFGCVLNESSVPRRFLKRLRCMLPINIRCAVTAELVGDELRGLPNGLQFDTHSVPIVGHDLERQWRGVVQYREFHCAIIELDASNVERVALNAM
jgi:hypothetical protein